MYFYGFRGRQTQGPPRAAQLRRCVNAYCPQCTAVANCL